MVYKKRWDEQGDGMKKVFLKNGANLVTGGVHLELVLGGQIM